MIMLGFKTNNSSAKKYSKEQLNQMTQEWSEFFSFDDKQKNLFLTDLGYNFLKFPNEFTKPSVVEGQLFLEYLKQQSKNKAQIEENIKFFIESNKSNISESKSVLSEYYRYGLYSQVMTNCAIKFAQKSIEISNLVVFLCKNPVDKKEMVEFLKEAKFFVDKTRELINESTKMNDHARRCFEKYKLLTILESSYVKIV